MSLTKTKLDAKLKQIAQFEEKWGECTRSRAMKKYCSDPKYRQRVNDFSKSIAQTMRNPNALGMNIEPNETI